MKKFIRRDHFFVYIVECANGTYYTGYTPNVEKRVQLHNNGRGAKYTRDRRPVKLVWSKACRNQRFAMRAEKTIKGLKREDKERIVQGSRLDNVLRRYK